MNVEFPGNVRRLALAGAEMIRCPPRRLRGSQVHSSPEKWSGALPSRTQIFHRLCQQYRQWIGCIRLCRTLNHSRPRRLGALRQRGCREEFLPGHRASALARSRSENTLSERPLGTGRCDIVAACAIAISARCIHSCWLHVRADRRRGQYGTKNQGAGATTRGCFSTRGHARGGVRSGGAAMSHYRQQDNRDCRPVWSKPARMVGLICSRSPGGNICQGRVFCPARTDRTAPPRPRQRRL